MDFRAVVFGRKPVTEFMEDFDPEKKNPSQADVGEGKKICPLCDESIEIPSYGEQREDEEGGGKDESHRGEGPSHGRK